MSEIGHNSGLSPEDAAAAMKRALAPHQPRADEFAKKAAAAKVDDMASAAAAVDFVRMARALADKADALLAEQRAPYQESIDALRGVALQFIDGVKDSADTVNARLAEYNEERRRLAQIAADEQAAAEEELRRRAEAIEGEPASPAPPPPPPPPAAPVKAAAIRTDFGGRMSDQIKWRPKVVDVTQVPEHVLKSPKVIAAIEQVSRDLLKNGIDVPGVEKQTYNSHSIS